MSRPVLTVDCGNTHTTLGCVDSEGRVSAVSRIPTDKTDTEFGYAARFKQIFDLHGIDPRTVGGAIISCVVPPITDVLRQAVALLTGHTPIVVAAGVKTGLHLAINDPGTVASDLVATAVAAKQLYPLPCVIVDMGTATTVTALDSSGRFIGGAFCPGTGISLTALADDTALLPHIEILPPEKAISTNTIDCMRSGIVYGSAGAVDGLLVRFEQELGETPTIVATGGICPLISPHCRHTMIQDKDLLLKGLRIIWDKNQK